MTSATLAAAYAIDWMAGDPDWLPHPVRAIGAAISTGERWLLRPGAPFAELCRGAILTGSVVCAACWLTRVAARNRAAEIWLAWTTLATRSLLDESGAVVDALDDGDLDAARRRLARIVGRDTDGLDEAEILRAVIETLAESLCDGIVAPLLYLTIGGAPLAMAFKSASTLDSMIGHRERPYLYFGRVAARLDDVANFVPARVTACSILVAHALLRAARALLTAWPPASPSTPTGVPVFLRDRYQHPSPNAGQCEAAMAGTLGVRLGGVNYYGGEASAKPLLNAGGRTPTRADARAAMRIAGIASILVFSAAWMWLRWRERRA